MRLRIGFIGLGTMGEPIANNLRKAGHDLTVWNRTAGKGDALVQKGARRAASPRACAEGKDAVLVCVSDEVALDAVLEGPEGVLAGLAAGDVLVDLSTTGTRAARSAAQRVAAKGAHLVVAPLLGSRVAAERAQLVVVVGGPAQARERVRPALHAVSARMFELDDPVQAALLKLCVNSVGAAMMSAFGEALALGRTGGLEGARILEVLQASTFHSPLFLMKSELVQTGDYAPRFKAALAEKDQRLAQEAAADQGARMPVNTAVRKLLGETVASGWGQKDLAAVAALLLEWANAKA
jgi:3-hydroxyisobutyrate dehydrogenase-like beta-hydroxyacid dehydrogenase